MLKISRLIKKYNPKVVHIEWIRFFKIDYSFLQFIKKRGIKVVYTAHNVLPHGDLKELQFDNYNKYYHEVDVIIVHTSRTKKELIEKFRIEENRIRVVPHGINKVCVSEQTVEELQKEYVERFNLKDKIVFAALGTQAFYKGYYLLKDAWLNTPELANSSNVELILAGNMGGVDLSLLKDCNNVHIVDGALSDEDFISLARISSVALLPYISISQSGVLMTAINEHIPVLVSDVGGLTEPLLVSKVGWSIGDPTLNNLKNGILFLINNREEINSVRTDTEAWDKVIKEFSWENSGAKTMEIYNELIK